MQKILASAEQVLAATGADDFTMAAVAERAGLSVGAIYRRFESREQLLIAVKHRLLGQVEDDLTAALGAVEGDLRDVVHTFTRTLAEGFSAGAHVIPHVAGTARTTESSERSRRALENIERMFIDVATVHLDQVRRSDPAAALLIAFRTITAACIHRAITWQAWPDGVSWSAWTEQVAGMAIAYLTSPDDGRPA